MMLVHISRRVDRHTVAADGAVSRSLGIKSDIACPRLSGAALCQVAVVIIYGCLHVLQDLVNRRQVSPALSIAHGGQAVCLDGLGLFICATNSRDWLVGGNVEC